MLSRIHSCRSFVRPFSAVAQPNLAARIDVSKIAVTKTSAPKMRPKNETLVFGASMTDHILEVDWTAEKGWHPPTITPYHKLAIDPAASVLHYGIEAFEGMKAYRRDDGAVALFRPDLNMTRLSNSMDRLAGPPLDKSGLLDAIKAFVRVERDWVPKGEGFSLYLRPTFISTWPFLGVSPAKSFKVFVVACPVGPYYPEGFKPVKLLADNENVRAWPGGIGAAKVGGNYAPTIKISESAAKKGFTQVLWLFGDQKELTEVGTMNFLLFWVNERGERELVTPPLDGTILPGVTRQSMLDLAREWGEFKVTERRITMAEVLKAASECRILEAFGAGTAAVVSPVKLIHFNGVDITVPLDPTNPSAGAGPLAQRLWDVLSHIQYGKVNHPWSVSVD